MSKSTTREDEERARQIRRKLDEVVGAEFDQPHLRGFGAWIRARWLKWLLGIVAAIAVPVLIVYMIESHRLPPEGAPAPKKAVPVLIIPAR